MFPASNIHVSLGFELNFTTKNEYRFLNIRFGVSFEVSNKTSLLTHALNFVVRAKLQVDLVDGTYNSTLF